MSRTMKTITWPIWLASDYARSDKKREGDLTRVIESLTRFGSGLCIN